MIYSPAIELPAKAPKIVEAPPKTVKIVQIWTRLAVIRTMPIPGTSISASINSASAVFGSSSVCRAALGDVVAGDAGE